MAILVADNFQYGARKPLDSRLVIDTIADMVALPESIIYEGILVYNKETKKFYSFDPANDVDIILGKWRKFKTETNGTDVKRWDENQTYRQYDIINYAERDIGLVLTSSITVPDNLSSSALHAEWRNHVINNDIRVLSESEVVTFYRGGDYYKNQIVIDQLTDDLYLVLDNFEADKTITDYTANLKDCIDKGHLKLVGGGSGNATLCEFQSNTTYKKDTLVYCGDRLGRIVADYTSANEASTADSFRQDIADGKIIVDKIDITELDSQLLKALPIVAFVTKKDIPRFESGIVIDGTVPTFRDGSTLSDTEKKGCNFFYVVDNNGELTGLAIVTQYDDTTDKFTVNAMKYGVGTTDNILPTHDKLSKRTVGEIQVIPKDDLLDPLFIIKSTAPVDTSKLWYESSKLDSSDVSIGSITVKKYDTTAATWSLTETIDVKEGEVVKNGNGAEWQYYRVQSGGNVFISLANWQLVYDTNQILGKIIDVNTTTHEVTIKTIHANPESDAVLEEDIQANIAIGAAAANFKYPKDMTFTEFVKKIAIKDILVTLNFAATGAGLIKKGTTINGSTLTATLTALGNVPIEKIKFYKGNTVLSENNYIDGTTVYTEVVADSITTDTTFAVVVEQQDNRNVQKEAKFVFVNPTYIGVVTSLSPSDAEILAFNENLKESFKGSYTVTMSDARTCIAYPSSMGNITSIKDNNNFEYINSFTKTTRTLNGESYNVYILTDAVTANNFKWTIN